MSEQKAIAKADAPETPERPRNGRPSQANIDGLAATWEGEPMPWDGDGQDPQRAKRPAARAAKKG